MSVKDNCLFYCHLKGIKVVEKQLQELLEIFELNELVNQKVKNLSGGQNNAWPLFVLYYVQVLLFYVMNRQEL